MTRNTNDRFALNPTRLDMSRSRFPRHSSVKTTFNVGDLIPFYVDEVLPGDTFSIDTSKVVRMQTLLTPMMDNVYLDIYWYFVPNRLTWSHWKEFMGENAQSAWLPAVEYSVPQVSAPSGSDNDGWKVGTIADYMGIPTGVPGISVNALYFRAYSLVCNEWFRDENLTDPLLVPTDDASVTGSNGNDYITDCAKGGMPFKAAKYHDYFTSCLPAPQKGPDVTISVGTGVDMPVVSKDESTNSYPQTAIRLKSSTGASLNGGNLAVSSPDNYLVHVPDTLGTADAFASIDNLWAISNGDASPVWVSTV